MKRLRVIAAVLVAFVAALAAGCGGDGGRLSKTEYEQKMQDIEQELESASMGLGDISDTGNLEQLADRIAEFRGRLENASDEVDDINPPANAETETQQIADALQAFADTFDEMEQAARDGDLQQLQQAQAEIGEKAAEAQRATASLERKGYDIGFSD